jgi:conjugative transposon TraM protein
MNINFKQPKYVLPLMILPFLCLFFYVWQSGTGNDPTAAAKQQDGLNPNVGSVSGDVRKKQLNDKLDAYRNTYKEATGLTAVAVIPKENSSDPAFHNDYTGEQRRRIDSIQRAMRSNSSSLVATNRPLRTSDADITGAVNAVRNRPQVGPQQQPSPPDPMEVFRQQMAIMDSVSKQNDPQWKEEQRKKQLVEQADNLKKNRLKLTVAKAGSADPGFNTLLPKQENAFINAVIDENATGYAGSRIRLKLLEDIRAGNNLIPKDSHLFAQITGFSEQRVTLAITSILSEGKILPVKLEVYDMDGLPGLYVPQSAFREFTKDLGSSSIQGVTIDGGTGTNQFMMSSLDKLFQSTSSAIAGAIRKNKAKLKYNSFIYLIDTDALQSAQKTY